MGINQKAIRVMNRVFEAGFKDEKSVAGMSMDDILALQGITVPDIVIINDLQKAVKTNKVVSYLSGQAPE